ncbi:unnamed protein product [Rotaria sp. Silwood2]|nr:unnamed protein product [Rotaria sp. Silwood2]CAF4418231.1 unnamed protein product [Rotaria sp. Silwood2]
MSSSNKNQFNSCQEEDDDDDENKNQRICLADDIHQVLDRLNQFHTNESKFLKDLKEWSNEAHDTVDKFYKSKHDEYIRRTKEDIDRSKEILNSLTSDHDASEDYLDWANNVIQSIHQQIDDFEQVKSIFSPLKIDNCLINYPSRISDLRRHSSPVKELFSDILLSSSSISHFNTNQSNKISFVNLKVPTHMIKLQSDNWYSLSANQTSLVVSEKTNLYLIDQSFTIIEKKSFIQIGIKDICWSNILSRFIIISPKNIYTLDDKLIESELSSINSIKNYPWERGTCCDTTLFISTFGENPFIIELTLFSYHLIILF